MEIISAFVCCFFPSKTTPQLANPGLHLLKSRLIVALLTYEFMQEHKRSDVACQTQELADYHEPVPRLNGQGHHQQLGQNQGGEGNGNNVDEL